MAVRGFEVLEEYKDFFTEEGSKAKDLSKPVDKPYRSTQKAAGYDICALEAHDYMPGEMYPLPTGITSYMQDDEVLQLFVRSGMAYNNQITLQNGTGIIDADYYGKHIQVMLRNEGPTPFSVYVGDRIAQGVFTKYLIADDEIEDTGNVVEQPATEEEPTQQYDAEGNPIPTMKVQAKAVRIGGLGSTGGNSASKKKK